MDDSDRKVLSLWSPYCTRFGLLQCSSLDSVGQEKANTEIINSQCQCHCEALKMECLKIWKMQRNCRRNRSSCNNCIFLYIEPHLFDCGEQIFYLNPFHFLLFSFSFSQLLFWDKLRVISHSAWEYIFQREGILKMMPLNLVSTM